MEPPRAAVLVVVDIAVLVLLLVLPMFVVGVIASIMVEFRGEGEDENGERTLWADGRSG